MLQWQPELQDFHRRRKGQIKIDWPPITTTNLITILSIIIVIINHHHHYSNPSKWVWIVKKKETLTSWSIPGRHFPFTRAVKLHEATSWVTWVLIMDSAVGILSGRLSIAAADFRWPSKRSTCANLENSIVANEGEMNLLDSAGGTLGLFHSYSLDWYNRMTIRGIFIISFNDYLDVSPCLLNWFSDNIQTDR